MATSKDVLAAVDDLVSEFLYHDRKEDEDLPRGEIERMIASGEITVEQILERFETGIRASLEGD